jgi:hypothetical protein
MHNQQYSDCPKLGWVKQQLIFSKRRRQCPRHTYNQARMKCNASSSPETPDLLMLDFRTGKMLRGTNKQSHLPGSSSFTFFSSLGLQQHVHCLHMHCHAICQLEHCSLSNIQIKRSLWTATTAYSKPQIQNPKQLQLLPGQYS